MHEDFVNSLHPLKQFLKLHDSSLEGVVQKAFASNPWFIPEFSRNAIDAIADQYLDEEKWKVWVSQYNVQPVERRQVAIIMAGNVPLVGFHDLMCVLSSGHNAVIKLSEKDSLLSKFITDEWIKIEPSLQTRISYTDKLEKFDAVIATGSNNTYRYFEYYFRNYPKILRRNRNGVAVLNGNETESELKSLAKDIFLYFGLGCRNVSKIYIPEGYDFSKWAGAIADWKYLSDHTKYRHNLDYNFAIYIINSIPHIHLDHLILKEDEAIASRIGCLHYSYYNDRNNLMKELEVKRNEIQCLVSKEEIEGWESIRFGETQIPSLSQYADGIDTIEFLKNI